MDGVLRNKGAQVTIWVVVALVIVATVFILFSVFQRTDLPDPDHTVFDIQSFIEQCTHAATRQAVDQMLPQGGFVAPQNTKRFNGIDIEYICENANNYNPCVNQHPLLISEMEREIGEFIAPKIEECLGEMKIEFEERGARVNLEPGQSQTVKLGADRILVIIDKEVSIQQQGQSRTFDNFVVEEIHPAYDLASVAVEIAAQEAEYCYFEYVGFKILYPRFTVDKYVLSESTKIYTITDENTGTQMNIAIRGCAIPPGF